MEQRQYTTKDGIKVPKGFTYSSDKNTQWMTKNEMQKWIDKNLSNIGKI